MKRLFLAILLSLSLVSSVNATPPISFGYINFTQTDNPIEQQSDYPWNPNGNYVLNSVSTFDAPCAWDVDDHWMQVTSGSDSLPAGQSVVATGCMVSDYTPAFYSIFGVEAWYGGPHGSYASGVQAASGDLIVTVCYQPQGRCFVVPARPLGNAFTYRFCGKAVYNPGDPALVEIVGSNGGLGIVQTITTTIHNPTNRRIGKLSATVAAVNVIIAEGACATPLGPEQIDYPWHWAFGV